MGDKENKIGEGAFGLRKKVGTMSIDRLESIFARIGFYKGLGEVADALQPIKRWARGKKPDSKAEDRLYQVQRAVSDLSVVVRPVLHERRILGGRRLSKKEYRDGKSILEELKCYWEIEREVVWTWAAIGSGAVLISLILGYHNCK